MAVELRRTLLLPLDDLLVVIREFINPDVSRSGLDRCLRRHGVSNLITLQPEVQGTAKPVKTFKDYEPGFLHIDIKYLPQMPDEAQRRYLFVAIDRATRWVFMRTYRDQSDRSSTDFLRRLKKAAPMKIKTILTDNGSQFTDRFTSTTRAPSGKHAFDLACKSMEIEHRLCPPRHPQTNGMVERFNGRISDIVNQTRFKSAAELDHTLMHYWSTYNRLIPQRALNQQAPVQALKAWQAKKPELFVKRVQYQPGLDTYGGLKGFAKHKRRPVLARAASSAAPALLVGPRDPTGRFIWWVQRLLRGGDVLAPDDPGAPVQFIDARDAATWMLVQAEQGTTGAFNGRYRSLAGTPG